MPRGKTAKTLERENSEMVLRGVGFAKEYSRRGSIVVPVYLDETPRGGGPGRPPLLTRSQQNGVLTALRERTFLKVGGSTLARWCQRTFQLSHSVDSISRFLASKNLVWSSVRPTRLLVSGPNGEVGVFARIRHQRQDGCCDIVQQCSLKDKEVGRGVPRNSNAPTTIHAVKDPTILYSLDPLAVGPLVDDGEVVTEADFEDSFGSVRDGPLTASELFSGHSEIFVHLKSAAGLFHEVVRVDGSDKVWLRLSGNKKKRFRKAIDYRKDFRHLTKEDLRNLFVSDFVWTSPPCPTSSPNAIWLHARTMETAYFGATPAAWSLNGLMRQQVLCFKARASWARRHGLRKQYFIFENPQGPFEKHPALQDLVACTPGVWTFCMKQCRWGKPVQKPTLLVSNLPASFKECLVQYEARHPCPVCDIEGGPSRHTESSSGAFAEKSGRIPSRFAKLLASYLAEHKEELWGIE